MPTITAIEPNGAIITLNNGERWLIETSDHATAAKWSIGHEVQAVKRARGVPGSCDLTNKTIGGNTVNANALLRFYVLHCVILPLAAAVMLAIHFWRIRKDGGLYTRGGASHE